MPKQQTILCQRLSHCKVVSMDYFTMNLEEIEVFTSKSSGFMRLLRQLHQIAMSRHPLLCMVVDNGQKLVDGDCLPKSSIAMIFG